MARKKASGVTKKADAKANGDSKKPDEVNKTQVIRDFILANKTAKPKEIADALAAKGIDVNPQYVSTVKFNMKNKRGGAPKKAGRKVTSKPAARASKGAAKRGPAAGTDMVSIAALRAAKKLADEMGGIAKARAALNALSSLTE